MDIRPPQGSRITVVKDAVYPTLVTHFVLSLFAFLPLLSGCAIEKAPADPAPVSSTPIEMKNPPASPDEALACNEQMKNRQQKPEYFPVKPGAWWVYRDHQDREIRSRILRAFAGGKHESVFGMLPLGEKGPLHLRLKTQRSMSGKDFEIKCFETISVDGREFVDCLKVVKSLSWPGLNSEGPAMEVKWFAPGVGLVRSHFKRGSKAFDTRKIQSFFIPDEPIPWTAPVPLSRAEGAKDAESAQQAVLAELIDRSILKSRDGCAVFQLRKPLSSGGWVGVGGLRNELRHETESPSWFFFVDLHPNAGYFHKVEYWWVDCATGVLTSAKHDWWPLVDGVSFFSPEMKDRVLCCDFGFFPGSGK